MNTITLCLLSIPLFYLINLALLMETYRSVGLKYKFTLKRVLKDILVHCTVIAGPLNLIAFTVLQMVIFANPYMWTLVEEVLEDLNEKA